MKPIQVTNDIFRLSLNVKDILFEQMWEIPQGVTLNSYIVRGEKLAIIDGFCGWDGVPEELFKLMDQLEVNLEDLDYIIINHMEPDHSGWIEAVKTLKPDVKIYCTKLASMLLEGFFNITENVHVIKSGEELDLGNGRVLKFIQQPNVHWPDTMFTYELSTKTLMPCDMFGSYGVCEGNHFDDQFSEEDYNYFWEEQIRYYSNVLVTYNDAAKKAIEKTKELAPKIIAPGHGPVFRKNVNSIIDNYDKIANFVLDEPLDEVTILWSSMYEISQSSVGFVEKLVAENNLACHTLQVPQTDIGTIMTSAIRSKAIIIIAPTYEKHLFPAMVAVIEELSRKHISNKKVMYIGGYGWTGGGEKDFKAICERYDINWNIGNSVTFRGKPSDEDFSKIKSELKILLEL